MNELTHDELLRVYKTFVMPLSQRPERSKRIKQNRNTINVANHNMQVDSLCDNSSASMDIDLPLMGSCNGEALKLNGSIRMTSPVGEKRRQPSSDDDYLEMMEDDYQQQLSSVTKRIRINTLS